MGEAFGEAVVFDVEGSARDVVDREVVEADVERLGDPVGGVERRGDAPVVVAADLVGVAGAGALREFGLGQTRLLSAVANAERPIWRYRSRGR